MSVLVTGAGGFLGGAVVERLLASGEQNLRCFVRPSSNLSRLEDLCKRYPQARIEHIVGNLATRRDARRAVAGVDTIYHVASAMRGAVATMFRDTVVASQCLLEAWEEFDAAARIVLISSLGVYGTSHLAPGYCVKEDCPLDPHPEERDPYTHAKVRQESLFRTYAAKHPMDLVVLRPGALYGAGGRPFSSRVGIFVGKTLLQLGNGRNVLPLSHVDNCADAVVIAGTSPQSSGQCYNVVDDDLPTAFQFIRAYQEQVVRFSCLHIPYSLALLASRALERYHTYSRGQIPALLTPYKTAASWKGHTFDNSKIKSLGWWPTVSTAEAMQRTFAYFRSRSSKHFPSEPVTQHQI